MSESDIVIIIDAILNDTSNELLDMADANDNGIVNIVDLVYFVFQILNP